MSQVLKSGTFPAAAAEIRPFFQPAIHTPAAHSKDRIDPALEAAHQRVAALTTSLAERDDEIVKLRLQVKQARLEGEAAGCVVGRRLADDGVAARQVALEAGVAEANATFQNELVNLERLALLIARDSLDRILGQNAERSVLVADIIRHQLAALRGEAALLVTVSGEDFAAVSAIEGGFAGSQTVELKVDPALASGDCSIRLRLGTVLVGLDQQWGRLRTALTELADHGDGRP